MEKLRRELEEKRAEVTRVKDTLQSNEKVCVCVAIIGNRGCLCNDTGSTPACKTKCKKYLSFPDMQILSLLAWVPKGICTVCEEVSDSFNSGPSFPPSLLHQVGEQLSSSMTSLQAEKERLMRSVSEKEAELSSLRQAAQLQQSSLQQERERSTRELGELQGKLQEKVSHDGKVPR